MDECAKCDLPVTHQAQCHRNTAEHGLELSTLAAMSVPQAALPPTATPPLSKVLPQAPPGLIILSGPLIAVMANCI